MSDIRLLDCTLRDGGFVNDWDFGKGSIKSIIGRLDKAGVDVIEIGFLDARRKYDPNRAILPDTKSAKPIMKNMTIMHALIVAMIDFGTCGIEAVEQQKDSCLDGIRVIFKKKSCLEAVKFCSELKEKGYKVFVQPVSVTEYSDAEMSTLLDEVNKIEPYSISIVDTYGLMHKKEMLHFYSLMDERLKKAICIGYHAHNNFQLAYANCVEFIEMNPQRPLMIDGSLYGMGKSAGNANTELLAMYLNKYAGGNYDVDQMLEAIDVDIMKEYRKQYWGYSLLHYISAKNGCHPEFVKNLIERKTLSVKSINIILQKIETTKRLTYNKELIETLYREFQGVYVDDICQLDRLREEFAGKKILLIGPGTTIETQQKKINSYTQSEKPAVISINFMTGRYNSDYVFIGNAKRYSQFYDEIYGRGNGVKVICTSNVTEADKAIDFVLNFTSLTDNELAIRDNPLLMLLRILTKIGVKSVNLAGFDGFKSEPAKNYYADYLKLLYCDDDVIQRNGLMKQRITEFRENMEITFLTDTVYE